MKEFSEALKEILAKIGDFFSVLDLSFFVSGSVCFAALVFLWAKINEVKLIDVHSFFNGFIIIAVILACYVLGLICFASGRWIRGRVKNYDRLLNQRLCILTKVHGLSDKKPFKEYFDRRRNEYKNDDLASYSEKDIYLLRLYIRLWAEVRQQENLAPSLYMINQFWVKAATYDGLAMSLIIWSIVILILKYYQELTLGLTIILFVSFIIFAVACFKEAERYVFFQLEELVATLAYQKSTQEKNLLHSI